ncbi:MAG: family 20 glycosylhydrolase, partial [Melioribacteraceae bacterium]
FVQRIEKFLNSKGRKIIGWDEILEGGLAPNAAVMSWRGTAGGIAAAKSQHNVVMSPGSHCYFDHYQGLSGEPKAFGGYTNLEKVYSYEPVPEALTEAESKFIMGAQANLWTEQIETGDHIEYMLLPRLCALSEVIWSPKESRQFADFENRMMKHYDILTMKNYNFRVPTPIDESGEYLLVNKKPIVFKKSVRNSDIFYTLDGTEPDTKSKIYNSPLKISKPSLIKARTVLKNGKSSPTISMYVSVVDTSVNGLNYKYYEDFWNTLPDFNSIQPLRSGKAYKLVLREFNTREDGYGLVINSLLKIDKAGEYTFFLNSDDGSRFFINNTELINNDGAHGSKELSGKINLKAGKHPLSIQYFEKDGSQNLKLEYEGPGIKRMPVPASSLFIK